jgi:hypothetical protein
MTMTIKYAMCGIAFAALVTPALAANEFYVVQNTTTQVCSVVGHRPTIATMPGVGTAYDTKDKAVDAMRINRNCMIK